MKVEVGPVAKMGQLLGPKRWAKDGPKMGQKDVRFCITVITKIKFIIWSQGKSESGPWANFGEGQDGTVVKRWSGPTFAVT